VLKLTGATDAVTLDGPSTALAGRLAFADSLRLALAQAPLAMAVGIVFGLGVLAMIRPLQVATPGMGETLPKGSSVIAYTGPGASGAVTAGSVVAVSTSGVSSLLITRVIAFGPGFVRLENGRIVTSKGLLDEPYATGSDGSSERYELASNEAFAIGDDRNAPQPLVIDRSSIGGFVFLIYAGPTGPRWVR
jgi:hypothetical protein